MTPLTFKKISLQRLPGLPKGIRLLDGLAPHINIITGPNGSGKSSTARFIQNLIWRKPMGNIFADTRFETGDAAWTSHTEPGISLLQKDGVNADLTGLPPREAETGYMLALHDLVVADDKDLAAGIARESIGGYNLEDARDKLGYGNTIKSTNLGEYKAYKQAAEKMKDLLKQQQELKDEEARLTVLNDQLEEARKATTEKAFYEKVQECLQAKEKVMHVERQLEPYPSEIENAREDDPDQLQTLEKTIRDSEDLIAEAETAISQHKEKIRSLSLPEEGPNREEILTLKKKADRLAETERELREASEKKAGAETNAAESLKGLGGKVNEEAWQGIDLSGIHDLDEFLWTAEQVSAEKQLHEQKKKRLQEDIHSLPEGDPETVSRGVRLLASWLKNDRSYFGIAPQCFYLMALAAVLVAMAVWLFGAVALAGLLLIAGLLLAGYLTKPAKQKQVYASDYAETGLQQPAEWNTENVAELLDALTEQLHGVKRRESLTVTLHNLKEEDDRIKKKSLQVQERYDVLLSKLHAVPGLPEQGLDSSPGLYHFLAGLQKWQEHNGNARAAEENISLLQERHAKTLGQINALLDNYDIDRVADAEEAKATCDTLEEKVQNRKDALDEIRVQRNTMDQAAGQRDKAGTQRHNIYERLGVEPGDTQAAKDLVQQLATYKNLRQQLAAEHGNLKGKQEALEKHALYAEKKEEPEQLQAEGVQEKISMAAEKSNRYEPLLEEAERIKAKVDRARHGQDLEQAIKEKEEALGELEGLFEQNVSAVTGHLLYEALNDEIREKVRPEVFKRAQRLFSEITQGRYKLILDEGVEADFRAFDNVQGRGQALEELSTGTRVQLLIAVRLAYIESKEGDLKLPLLADELLANSDDERARAIIDALIAISRQGRQVFYFTAQQDEVERWQDALAGNEQLSYQIISLAGEPNEAVKQKQTGMGAGSLQFSDPVPEPGNLSYNDYGRKLEVPSYDPLTDYPGELHLWYLVEDTSLLYRLLRRGIRTWGQLRGFVNFSGTVEGLTDEAFSGMKEKIRLLEDCCEIYQTGRSRQIDAGVLKQSGAVSDKFMDEVGQKLRELGGDPKALICSLQNGEIKKFRNDNIDKLENFLIDEGYLDQREPFSGEALQARMSACLSNTSVDPEEGERFLKAIFESD